MIKILNNTKPKNTSNTKEMLSIYLNTKDIKNTKRGQKSQEIENKYYKYKNKTIKNNKKLKTQKIQRHAKQILEYKNMHKMQK